MQLKTACATFSRVLGPKGIVAFSCLVSVFLSMGTLLSPFLSTILSMWGLMDGLSGIASHGSDLPVGAGCQ